MKRIVTQSHSVYLLDEDRIRRESLYPMRRDGEWLTLLSSPHPIVGERMELCLEPLGADGCTIRTSTPVVSITEVRA